MYPRGLPAGRRPGATWQACTQRRETGSFEPASVVFVGPGRSSHEIHSFLAGIGIGRGATANISAHPGGVSPNARARKEARDVLYSKWCLADGSSECGPRAAERGQASSREAPAAQQKDRGTPTHPRPSRRARRRKCQLEAGWKKSSCDVIWCRVLHHLDRVAAAGPALRHSQQAMADAAAGAESPSQEAAFHHAPIFFFADAVALSGRWFAIIVAACRA